jgi:hypothetical protein
MLAAAADAIWRVVVMAAVKCTCHTWINRLDHKLELYTLTRLALYADKAVNYWK